jgi:flagellar hook-length control protein FliK
MSIEGVPAGPVPRAVDPGPQTTKSTTTSDKDSKRFSDVMNGLDAEPDAAKVDETSPSKEADSEDEKKAVKKLASKKNGADGVAPDATTVMAGLVVPVTLPVNPAPVDAAVAVDSVSVESVATVPGGAEGDAGAATKGLPQGGAAGSRVDSVGLANYASVFEQIQSRRSKGDSSTVELAQTNKQGAESGVKGAAKPVLGTAAADARNDRLTGLGTGGFVLPVVEASAVPAATDATESLKRVSSVAKGAEASKPAEGAPVLQGFTSTVQFDSASQLVDISQASPEKAVADQVSYWISQGVQNAELTFNGADSQPVEVRISLAGNEAHVAFRSDQAETRDFLSGAAAHLKDMLQSEGMVLSGMSVGSSGADNTGARERRAPAEVALNNSRKAREEVAIQPVALPRASGRALDLFV